MKSLLLIISLLGLNGISHAVGLANDPEPFVNVQSADYWSGSSSATDSGHAWKTNANTTNNSQGNKHSVNAYVFLERGNLAVAAADCNGNGSVDITDIVCTINIVLDPSSPGRGNCTQSEGVNIQDIVCAINVVLQE